MQNGKCMHKVIDVVVGRAATLAAVCGLALAVLSLPVGVDSSGFVSKPAFAAGGNGNGNGHGRDGAPGQNKEDVAGADDLADSDVDSAVADSAESGDSPEEMAVLPISEDLPANAKVIKEIAGLSEDSELSDEEELDAIRSGWGTWRTADGPESVVTE